MFTKHSIKTRYVYKTKMYRQVMFTKQKQNRKFTNVLYLQNQNKIRSLQTSYVYKIKFTNTLCLQNKTKVLQILHVYKTKHKTERLQTRYVYKQKIYIQVMFTKQKQNKTFIDKLCLQNKRLETSHVNITCLSKLSVLYCFVL